MLVFRQDRTFSNDSDSDLEYMSDPVVFKGDVPWLRVGETYVKGTIEQAIDVLSNIY